MKIITVLITILLLSGVSQAQIIKYKFEQHPSFQSKKPKLNIKWKEPYFSLKQFTKPDLDLTIKSKPNSAVSNQSLQNRLPENYKSSMPIIKPDSAIYLPMLAARPDSTVRYHLRVKKPTP